jgi:hypothetical protein
MTRQKWLALAIVFVLVGVTGTVLSRSKSLHKLGRPGLKLVAEKVYDVNTNVIGTQTVPLPAAVLEYRSQVAPISLMEVNWLPKDTTFARRVYEASNSVPLMLSVILMGSDHGSIHNPKICFTGQGWQIGKEDFVNIPVSRPHSYELPVVRMTADKKVKLADGREGLVRGLYVYWFVADHALTARRGQRMWAMAKELLRSGTLQRWAYVSCLTYCEPGQETAAFEAMKRFLAAAVPEFQLATGPAGPAPAHP